MYLERLGPTIRGRLKIGCSIENYHAVKNGEKENEMMT